MGCDTIRRLIKVIAVVLITSFVISTYYYDVKLKQISDHNYISPSLNIQNIETDFYYVSNEKLIKRSKTAIIKDKEIPKGLLDYLNESSRNKSYGSLFEQGFEVIGVDVYGNVGYVNLKVSNTTSSVFENKNLYLYIWGVINTLTELQEVLEVQLLFNGEKINLEVLDYNLRNPLPRLEWLTLSMENEPVTIARKFEGYITQKRYDLAYSLVSDESKKIMSYEKFVVESNNYNSILGGYTLKSVDENQIGESWELLFNYRDIEYNSMTPVWHIKTEDGFYKIDLHKRFEKND